MKLVNSENIKQAPAESMIHLGQYIQQLINTLAENYDNIQFLILQNYTSKMAFGG